MLPLIALLPIAGLAAAAADILAFEKADILTDCLTRSNSAIAVPTTVRPIQDAVAYASKIGVKANAKCGGHSYGSFGLGGENGHLTIEVDRMIKLYNQGKRAFSHGTCPGVGVAGHVLHGGRHLLAHTHGLAQPSTGSTPVRDPNPRQLQPKAPWKTEQQAREGMTKVGAFQDFVTDEREKMTRELNMRLFITNRFTGLQAVLGPLLKATNASLVMAQQGGLKHFGNGHETFYSSSLYTKPFTPSQPNSPPSHPTANKRDWYVQIDVHGGPTSAVTVPEVDSTAYAHRNYLFMFLFYNRIDRGVYPAEGFTAIQNFVGNVTVKIPVEEWGMYVNYPDLQMEREAAQKNYWGQHLDRLTSVKGSVDPGDLFSYPQGVVPAV
ncbi:hypothetical protein QBC45DRAFT_450583 [Copromyces sp. CBS 386.78]|nr:hypothetical protein QBC45DRAFT_450583 [Copromyces sp. CBS 386.78]